MSIANQIANGLREYQRMYSTVPIDTGELAAASIISELRGRSGIGNVFDSIDDDTMQEIHRRLSDIVNTCIGMYEDDDLMPRIKVAIEDRGR